jgi:LacI family transcriptional regulator
MPTIIEVAKRANVSTATVSNVIRGTRKVSEELTKRVQDAVAAMDYTPNEIARSLKVKQTRMLAMVLPDITNPFFPEIIRGAEDAAFGRGYFLLTANTNEQLGRERRIISALRSYRVDGILLATAQSSYDRDSSHIASLIGSGCAVVCLDRSVPDVTTDAVLLDNLGGARACVRHLISQGHRRIAIITGALHLQTGFERLQGYKLAFEEAGIPIDERLIVEGDFRVESGKRRCEQLLKGRSKMTAIFSCNGMMMLGVLRALDEVKLSSPGDYALATFDEVSLDHSSRTQLTTVVQPSYEMGFRAANMLMDRIEGRLGRPGLVVRVEPRLEVRDSTSLRIGTASRAL